MRVKDRIFTRMREKEFVTHEEALALKELRFDETCFGRFSTDNYLIVSHTETYNTDFRKTLFTQAPTFSQAFRWFREKHGLYPDIYRIGKKFNAGIEDMNIGSSKEMVVEGVDYEEAELGCLKKLIEIVKRGNK